MNNVIKRRKTSHYAQIHNSPLQGGLEDLRAVGLLAHIMSLPEDWTIYKTQLHNMYSRKNVDAGWKELAEKNYAIGFSCYVNGKRNYFYNVSDIPFTQAEFEEFAIEQIQELQNKGKTVKSVSIIKHTNLAITDNITNVLIVQQSNLTDFTDVRSVQYSGCSTKGAYTKEIENKEKETNKHLKDIVNKETIVDNSINNIPDNFPLEQIINDLTNEYRLKGLSKTVCLKVVQEVKKQNDIKNFGAYLRSCLETTLHRSEVKRGLREPAEKLKEAMENSELGFYDWLNN